MTNNFELEKIQGCEWKYVIGTHANISPTFNVQWIKFSISCTFRYIARMHLYYIIIELHLYRCSHHLLVLFKNLKSTLSVLLCYFLKCYRHCDKIGSSSSLYFFVDRLEPHFCTNIFFPLFHNKCKVRIMMSLWKPNRSTTPHLK